MNWLKKLSKKPHEVEWHEIVSFLKNQEVLEGEGGKKILEGMKLYNDRFPHTVGTHPSIEETILVKKQGLILLRNLLKTLEN